MSLAFLLSPSVPSQELPSGALAMRPLPGISRCRCGCPRSTIRSFEHPCVLLLGLLQPEGKPQPFFSRHLAVGIGLGDRATVQQNRTPRAVPPRRCFQLPVPDTNQLMKVSLACPSLCANSLSQGKSFRVYSARRETRSGRTQEQTSRVPEMD